MIAKAQFGELLEYVKRYRQALEPHKNEIFSSISCEQAYMKFSRIEELIEECMDVVSRYEEKPTLKNDW